MASRYLEEKIAGREMAVSSGREAWKRDVEREGKRPLEVRSHPGHIAVPADKSMAG